jgi:hypothetical protein
MSSRSTIQKNLHIGRVAEMLQSAQNTRTNIVTLKHYLIGDNLYPQYDMPVVRKAGNGSNRNTYIAVPPEVRVFCKLEDRTKLNTTIDSGH